MNFDTFTRSTQTTTKRPARGRVGAILERVGDLLTARSLEPAADYGQLVNQLVAAELDPKAPEPELDHILAVCEAAGKTPEELDADVDKDVRLAQNQAEVTQLPEAIESLEKIKQQKKDHEAKFQKTVAAMQAERDRLDAEFRETSRRVARLQALKSSLIGLAGGPSPEEQALTQKIISLTKEETRLRMTTGRMPLSDKFIGADINKSETAVRLNDVTAECKRLDEIIAQGNGNGMSAADFKLRKLLAEKATLERKLNSERSLYRVGAQVAEVRERIAQTAAERDRLRAERIAELAG